MKLVLFLGLMLCLSGCRLPKSAQGQPQKSRPRLLGGHGGAGGHSPTQPQSNGRNGEAGQGGITVRLRKD